MSEEVDFIIGSVPLTDKVYRAKTYTKVPLINTFDDSNVKENDERADAGYQIPVKCFRDFLADDIAVIKRGPLIELGEVVHMRTITALAFTDGVAKNYIFFRTKNIQKDRLKKQQKRLRVIVIKLMKEMDNLNILEFCDELGITQ